MAIKHVGGVASVLVGGLTLPARMLANLAAEAGVHRYIDPGDVIRTDGRFMGITACKAGRKTVCLPAPCEVADLFSAETVCRGTAFDVDVRLGETRVYRMRWYDCAKKQETCMSRNKIGQGIRGQDDLSSDIWSS